MDGWMMNECMDDKMDSCVNELMIGWLNDWYIWVWSVYVGAMYRYLNK